MKRESKKLVFEIGEDYRVIGDKYSWTLENRTVSKKTGKHIWVIVGFYGRLAHLINALIEYDLRVNPELSTIQDYVDRTVKISEDYEKVLREIKKEHLGGKSS